MIVGYARVSTADQNLDLQRDALKKAGCVRIYEDTASGAVDSRKGLQEALGFVRDGDTLAVWKLDRLGRSLQHLVATVSDLNQKGIGFLSIQESLDTSSSGGRLVFHMFAALAQFELDLIRERTMAGLASARARGRLGGRPSVMNEKKIAIAKQLIAGDTTATEICKTLGLSKATLYRHLYQLKST